MDPCTCSVAPVRSGRERLNGAKVAHVTDERGTWHGVAVGGRFFATVLVTPSAAEIEARAADAASPKPAQRIPSTRALALVLRELRGGAAAPAEAHAIVDALTAEDPIP